VDLSCRPCVLAAHLSLALGIRVWAIRRRRRTMCANFINGRHAIRLFHPGTSSWSVSPAVLNVTKLRFNTSLNVVSHDLSQRSTRRHIPYRTISTPPNFSIFSIQSTTNISRMACHASTQ
jgi:hypothetical protein